MQRLYQIITPKALVKAITLPSAYGSESIIHRQFTCFMSYCLCYCVFISRFHLNSSFCFPKDLRDAL